MESQSAIKTNERKHRITAIAVVVTIIAAVVVLVLVVEALPPHDGPTGQPPDVIGQPVSSTILQQLTGVSKPTLVAVGLPNSVTPPAAINGSALTSGGKPEIVYVGGEFCPYCAVERWSIIIALSHFGNFSGLEYMQSSSTDVNPDTPTFTFAGSSSVPFNFTSKYITFLAIEEFDRSENVRQPLNATEQALVTQYDTCASTGAFDGIPFIDIANAYVVNCGAQFSLPQIAGDNWTSVASQLNTPSTTVAQEMDGTANALITAICKVDGEQPSSVCTQPYATVALASTATSTQTATTDYVYKVTFQQTGQCSPLVYWAPWYVTVGNMTEVEPSNATIPFTGDSGTASPLYQIYSTIVFPVPDGTYNYTIYFQTVPPGTQTLVVSGSDVTIDTSGPAVACAA